MRYLVIIIVSLLMTSCTTKYKGLHNNFDQFKDDVDYCVKKVCKSEIKSSFIEFSIISPARAYGGAGGGLTRKSIHKVSLQRLNICLKERGYSKDENGLFVLPTKRCN